MDAVYSFAFHPNSQGGLVELFFSGSSIRELPYEGNRYLEVLSKWLHENIKQLNASKATYILFRPINKKIYEGILIEYQGNMISQVNEQKFLGVWYHETLSWHPRIEHLGIKFKKYWRSLQIARFITGLVEIF